MPLTKNAETQERHCNQKENSHYYKDSPPILKNKTKISQKKKPHLFFSDLILPLLLTKFHLTVAVCFFPLFSVPGHNF